MTFHHASDETLLRFASGDLPAGPALVLATHLSQCPACRAAVRSYEDVGGALLASAADDLELCEADKAVPSALLDRLNVPGDARAAGALDASGIATLPRAVARQRPDFPAEMRLPKPLQGYDIGPWRFAGPGMQWAKVHVPDDARSKVMLLRVRPKVGIPFHTHEGTEYMCILHGRLNDGERDVGIGGFSENDERHHHQPVVASHDDCICVTSVDGRLLMQSWIARVAQRLIGF